ncbi:hypothetical protein ACOZ4F_00075 (plasmid) [Haloarcula marismortui]|uniref:hypothetical protein n=1 Tax=Haloarcula marismortui TaxID=2238 RepID=UPI003C74B054
MTGLSRRDLLKIGGAVGIGHTAGCLRLQGDSGGEETVTPNPSTDTTTEAQLVDENAAGTSAASSGSHEINRFYLDHFDDGNLRDTETLYARANGNRVEINGTWEGDTSIMSRQTCARYSFEVLEDGSVIASSGEKLLIYGYQYVFAQSTEAAFITHHPSISAEWERTLRLSYPSGESEVTPEVRPDEGVFEFNFADSNVEPGRYDWILEITPPNSYTIEVGTFFDQLIQVNPPEDSPFPSSSEAMQDAGAVSNSSATLVQPSQKTTNDGLRIQDSGHGGGTSSDTTGRFLTRDVGIECSTGCAFGAEANRKFRINNLTSGTSLTFTPR